MTGSRRSAVAAVQARTSSTRLPGKVLADLAGKPLVERVVERLRACGRVDEVFVLTSRERSDDPLAAACEARGIAVRRGPLEDVLARYLALVDELEPRYVVRVTGDCPLVHAPFVDLQLEALAAFDGDLVRVAGGTDDLEGVLGGQTVLSARALRAAAASSDPRDREHVGSFWFQEHAQALRWVEVTVDDAFRRPGLRLCVDEPGDLALVRRIHEAFADEPAPVALERVLAWLAERPEVESLNRAVRESDDNRALRRRKRERRGHAVPLVGRWP